MANPDQDRVNALNTTNTTFGNLTPSDSQNRTDIETVVTANADEVRRLQGSKAFDIGGIGTPCRK